MLTADAPCYDPTPPDTGGILKARIRRRRNACRGLGFVDVERSESGLYLLCTLRLSMIYLNIDYVEYILN